MTDDILSQVKEAEQKADKMLDLAKEEAHKLLEESKPVIERAKNKSDEIKNQELAGLDKTVDLLVERIINNGNS